MYILFSKLLDRIKVMLVFLLQVDGEEERIVASDAVYSV